MKYTDAVVGSVRKRICKECGKVWYVEPRREKMIGIAGAAMSLEAMATDSSIARASAIGAAASLSRIMPNKCPACGGMMYDEEIIYYRGMMKNLEPKPEIVCPMCKSLIPYNAPKCCYCQSDLSSDLVNANVKNYEASLGEYKKKQTLLAVDYDFQKKCRKKTNTGIRIILLVLFIAAVAFIGALDVLINSSASDIIIALPCGIGIVAILLMFFLNAHERRLVIANVNKEPILLDGK
jgi:hypothetical protein